MTTRRRGGSPGTQADVPLLALPAPGTVVQVDPRLTQGLPQVDSKLNLG